MSAPIRSCCAASQASLVTLLRVSPYQRDRGGDRPGGVSGLRSLCTGACRRGECNCQGLQRWRAYAAEHGLDQLDPHLIGA